MGEYFGLFIVRCHETDNLAMPCAAIEIVVTIKDHIFRALKLAQTNIFSLGNLVVQCVGCS